MQNIPQAKKKAKNKPVIVDWTADDISKQTEELQAAWANEKEALLKEKAKLQEQCSALQKGK